MALLKLVAEIGGEFTLSEMAERAQIPVSSVHRLLQTLIDAGLVERASGQAYRPGSAFFGLARQLLKKADMGRWARPLIKQLWDEWQETCAFCLYQPHSARALVVDTIPTPHPLRYVVEPLTEISLVWGSLGRSILAFLPKDEREQAIAASPRIGPLSSQRLPSRKALEEELADIRRRGVAIYRNEALDLAGIAAPVRHSNGAMFGSIGIIMPNSRFSTKNAAPMMRSVHVAASRFRADVAEL
jgi:DNA-binding IclR family transcriptional regulator